MHSDSFNGSAEPTTLAARHRRIPRQTTATGVTDMVRTVRLNNWIKQRWILKWLVKAPKNSRKP
jgi:hypothetical protein